MIFNRRNLKLFIYVVIAILIIRHGFFQPFKIRTPSMEPALIGDPGCGDHILVNKFLYHFRSPQRWEVVVFRHPLNPTRKFMKRVVGLPGEKITIKNGNIFVNDRVLRKPAPVQNQLFHPLFAFDKQSLSEFWKQQGQKWCLNNRKIALTTKHTGWCYYARPISDAYRPINDNWFYRRSLKSRHTRERYHVGELRLALRVRVISGQGAVLLQIRNGRRRFLVTLAADKAESLLQCYRGEALRAYQKVPLNFRLVNDRDYAIVLSNLDAQIVLTVDSQTLLLFDYARSPDEIPMNTYESGVKFGARHGSFEFSRIFLWRDTYYLGQDNIFGGAASWIVPSGHYFVLGDNCANSNDSRNWRKFRMILNNGLFWEGDQSHLPHRTCNGYTFIDSTGLRRKIGRSQLREELTMHIAAPFLPRHLLTGKAILVFWPPPRLKIIH